MSSFFLRRLLILSLFSLFLPLFSQGQKVGVVLSGGGAKGLYHIGILQALEDNNIPIDYITGTSMGAIVGGLYCAGYSPAQIQELFQRKEINGWITGEFDDRHFYQKAEPDGSMVEFNVDLHEMLRKGDGHTADSLFVGENRSMTRLDVAFSKALRSSLQLDLASVDLFSAASIGANHNFDSLFVPFRCVSVDMLRRKQFVWKEGDLGLAIRSSMAIPMVFQPIAVDSMVLYDGGILNNFPWKEMRDTFHPDFIVGGVCVGTGKNHTSLIGQVDLIVSAQTDFNMDESLGVVLQRDVQIGMLEYEKVDYAVMMGYNDAMEQIMAIKRRAGRQAPKEEVQERRRAYLDTLHPMVIDKIEISGLTPKQRHYVESQLRVANGEVVDFETFKTDFLRVLSSGQFQSGFPKVSYNPHSRAYTISVEMRTAPALKAMAGVSISSLNLNEAYLGFQYSSVRRFSSTYTLDGYFGNFYSTANIATRQNFYGAKVPFYLQANVNYTFQDYGRGNHQKYSYENRSFEFSRLNEVYGAINGGIAMGRAYKLDGRVALGRNYYRFDQGTNINNTSLNHFDQRYSSLNLSIRRNTLNYKVYPTQGLKQTLSLISNYSQQEFTPALTSLDTTQLSQSLNQGWMGLSLSHNHYIPIASNFTVGYSAEAIYTTLKETAIDYTTTLVSPGFYPTEHSMTLLQPQFHAPSYWALGLQPIIEWNDYIYLKTEAYIFKPNLLEYQNYLKNLHYIAAATIVYQSPIGPVSLNYSRYGFNREGTNFVNFTLGFILFKERGISFF